MIVIKNISKEPFNFHENEGGYFMPNTTKHLDEKTGREILKSYPKHFTEILPDNSVDMDMNVDNKKSNRVKKNKKKE